MHSPHGTPMPANTNDQMGRDRHESPLVFARIVDGEITPALEARELAPIAEHLATLTSGGMVGATMRFEGIVRRDEPAPGTTGVSASALLASAASGANADYHPLHALDYQTYDPMAERELHALAGAITREHAMLALVALHSRGRVRVGRVSFLLIVASPRRAGAIAAMGDFIDRLKRDVPIWKSPVWA